MYDEMSVGASNVSEKSGNVKTLHRFDLLQQEGSDEHDEAFETVDVNPIIYSNRTAFVPERCCHGTVMITIILILSKSNNAKYRFNSIVYRQVQLSTGTQYCCNISAFSKALFMLLTCAKYKCADVYRCVC